MCDILQAKMFSVIFCQRKKMVCTVECRNFQVSRFYLFPLVLDAMPGDTKLSKWTHKKLSLIVVFCLLLSASAVANVVANTTSPSTSAINAASSASAVSASSAALTFRPGGASRGRGSGHHGQVLFKRKIKKVYFSPYFT